MNSPHHAQGPCQSILSEKPGGQVEVARLQEADQGLERYSVGLQCCPVQADSEFPFGGAEKADLAHAVHVLDRLLDRFGTCAQFLVGNRSGKAEHEDGPRAKAELAYNRPCGVHRQLVDDAVDGLLHIHDGRVGVRVHRELQDRDTITFSRGRADVLDAREARDGVLHRLDEVLLYLLRSRARVEGMHADEGCVGGGEEVGTELEVAEDAQSHQEGKYRDQGCGSLYGQFGEAHWDSPGPIRRPTMRSRSATDCSRV